MNLEKNFRIPIPIRNCKENSKNVNFVFNYGKDDYVIRWNEEPDIFPYFCSICGYSFKTEKSDNIIKCESHLFTKNCEIQL